MAPLGWQVGDDVPGIAKDYVLPSMLRHIEHGIACWPTLYDFAWHIMTINGLDLH